MANDAASDSPAYVVVRNLEEQYSIWPVLRPLPNGWEAVPKSGTLDECLAYITEVWTDMRPLSVRTGAAG
jgi:MbtH protein